MNRIWLALASTLVVACTGIIGDAPGDGGGPSVDGGPRNPDGSPAVVTASAGAARRLSVRELTNSVRDLTGVDPTTVASYVPDNHDLLFDRVVESQTISDLHAESYQTAASEVAAALFRDRTLDRIGSACAPAILPPPTASATQEFAGTELAGDPAWAFHASPSDPTGHTLETVYAEAPREVSLQATFPSAGSYRIGIELKTYAMDWAVSIDGAARGAFASTAATDFAWYSVDVDADVGSHRVAWRFSLSDRYQYVRAARIEGPVDPGVTRDRDARRACADSIVDELAPRAFRRPITDAERTRLRGLYQTTEAASGFRAGATALVQAILGSPKFLYMVEVGTPVAARPGHFALTDHEVAARLSYFLCESPPDAELRAAAARGALQTDAEVATQARRLLALPCARATLRSFYQQWLELNQLPSLARNTMVFPEWNQAMREAMIRESDRFVEGLTFDERGGYRELMTAQVSWLDRDSAPLYGLTSADATPTRTALPAERAGLLTLPGFMAVHARPHETAPVNRGVFVLRNVICGHIDPPPASLMVVPPMVDPTATTRQRYAMHSSQAACRTCHSQIDPVGFAMEDFDALGRHRATENGLPVDSRGGFPSIGVADGALDGAGALAGAIARSPQGASCFARQWLRYALGRMDRAADADAVAQLAAAAVGPAGLVEMIVAVTTSYPFRHRIVPEEL